VSRRGLHRAFRRGPIAILALEAARKGGVLKPRRSLWPAFQTLRGAARLGGSVRLAVVRAGVMEQAAMPPQ